MTQLRSKLRIRTCSALIYAVLTVVSLVYSTFATAFNINNPVLPGTRADPHISFFEGRYWIYNTAQPNAFSSFQAFSSSNLVDWQPEGEVLNLGPAVSWGENDGWAPGVANRNGLYYFYFSVGPPGPPARIGVATSFSPAGPFYDFGVPIVLTKADEPTVEAIDAQVFIDDDGQTYMYYGGYWGHKLGIQKLAADMITRQGPLQIVNLPNYTEGPFMHKRNGIYYMTYSAGVWFDGSYNVQYATAPTPTGPFTYRGQILSRDDRREGPGHHSIIQQPGTDNWYIAYHYWDSLFTGRHTAIDPLRYHADGTLQRVVMSGGGMPVRLESQNYPGRFVRHIHSRGKIDANVAPLEDSQFVMMPGLSTANPKAVSFLSKNFPDHYLRHRNGEVWIDLYDGTQLFENDATFLMHNGFAGGNTISFAASNFPNNYLRHKGGELFVEAIDTNNTLQRSDASWVIRNPRQGIVTVYEHCNYEGWSAQFNVGDFNLAQLQAAGAPNDAISSIRVTTGFSATLFQDDGRTGNNLTVTGEIPCLVSNGFNDLASSMRVQLSN